MFAPTIVRVFLLASLLTQQVQGHGCNRFNLTDEFEIAKVLRKSDDFVPASIKKTIIEKNSTAFYGNYDCHIPDWSDYEVGVAYLCNPETQNCECTALYDFQECNSCSVCGSEIDDVNSFSADCSNIKGATDSCTVECGFVTSGCRGEKPLALDDSESSAPIWKKVSLFWGSLVALLLAGSLTVVPM